MANQHVFLYLVLLTSAAAFSSITPSSLSSFVGINGKFTIKSERREEFLALIKDDKFQTLQTEPAALQFIVGEDTASRNTFYLHEKFTTLDGFHLHQKTSHFAKWVQFTKSSPFAQDGEPIFDIFDGAHSVHQKDTKDVTEIAMSSTPLFCLNVELCIKPEIREDFLQVISINKKGSDEEPLCSQYHYGESISTPNSFYFHEEYIGIDGGKEGFDAHAIAPHFQVWENFAGKKPEPFTKPPVVSFYRPLN